MIDHLITSCYEYFIISTSKPDYKFRMTPSKENVLIKFQNMALDKYGNGLVGIGSHWVYEYTLFQINRYYHSSEYNSRDVFGWFYGPKAFDRWVNRAAGWRYGIADGLQSRFNFYEEDAINYMEGNTGESLDVTMKRYEDKTRRKQDFTECLLRTTLYHPMTSACRTCPAKEDCKSMLKFRHKQIYINRLNRLD